MNRVVITGIGAVTPIGNTAEEFLKGLKSAKLGIAPLTRFEGGGVMTAEVKGYDPEKYISKKELKRYDLFSQYAMSAACEAFEQSGLKPGEFDPRRFGVIVGSGFGGMNTIENDIIKLNRGEGRVSTLFVPMSIINMAAGNIAIRFGAKGICTSIVTACATGTNCIGEAFRNIKHGYSDVIAAGGTEATITPVGIAGFRALKALSLSSDPERASIPFDKERGGFVMGEGAGILILEEYEHARKRGAGILAEVVGYGTNCDAYHMTAPLPSGAGAAEAMTAAVNEAGIGKEKIGYINAHGTGTQLNDLSETRAIKLAFGEAAYNIPISSTKSMTGHLLGAAGAVEAIACVLAMKHGFIAPTVGLRATDEDCDLNYTKGGVVKKDVDYALSNSLGFGGHNASLCLKRWDGNAGEADKTTGAVIS